MITREYFEELKARCFSELHSGEHLTFELTAESSQFIRMNAAKIRQIGSVENATLDLALLTESGKESSGTGLRKSNFPVTMSGRIDEDRTRIRSALTTLRAEAATLPIDPYAELPSADVKTSITENRGKLLALEESPETLLSPAAGLDIAGIYAAGTTVRASATSAGTSHWFSTESFSFDHSAYTPSRRALRGCFAGQTWDSAAYTRTLAEAREKLTLLEREPRRLAPGNYRVYLAPDALGFLVSMLSWGAIGEASIRQSESPLRLLRSGDATLSPKLRLAEDFRGGESPRFNSEGELAPEHLPLIQDGRLVQSLVSARSAREYGIPSNGANRAEALRAAAVEPGTLRDSDILKALDTGLYISDLHYLNWSDQPGGRITGMTRYACFWVENGRIVSPIENLRFDDTIFRLLGSELLELTEKRVYVPDTASYINRAVGGAWMPGALLSAMRFTL